jgi:predicted RNA polymerase sigma factor
LYDDQDSSLWNKELIDKGKYFLKQASEGKNISKYHIEACIAYWHTEKNDTKKKWESILQLYNQLLLIEYSPIAALNRTYALSKANGKESAIEAAEKLDLNSHHLYHILLGNLYTGINQEKAVWHLKKALALAKSSTDKKTILKQLAACE